MWMKCTFVRRGRNLEKKRTQRRRGKVKYKIKKSEEEDVWGNECGEVVFGWS